MNNAGEEEQDEALGVELMKNLIEQFALEPSKREELRVAILDPDSDSTSTTTSLNREEDHGRLHDELNEKIRIIARRELKRRAETSRAKAANRRP